MAQDNQALRALFTLPPICESASTALSVPAMPPQKVVTGDNEVDAVLWLQDVAGTGNQVLIDKAVEAAQRITTPMKTLSDRYMQILLRQNPQGGFGIALETMHFGDIKAIGQRAKENAHRRHEGLSRFGSERALISETKAEKACRIAMKGLRKAEASPDTGYGDYNLAALERRFSQHIDLQPATLADVLHVEAYWSDLYWLRNAVTRMDGYPAGQAHDDYCFNLLTTIKPQSQAEAVAVLDYLDDGDRGERVQVPAILRNLISGGWQ